MKKHIGNLLWFLIRKLEGEIHIKQTRISSDKVEIKVRRYLPPDGTWNHVVTTASWIKVTPDSESYEEVAIWVNKEKVAEYLLSEVVENS